MDTECCVCFEDYRRTGSKCPKLLPCVHTFCAQCLTRLTENGKIKCPECRSWHPLSEEGVQTLPTNGRILEYLNSLLGTDNQQKDNNNNGGIYNLPSSGILCSVDICELHGQPYVMTRCDIDGPKQKLCEVCLGINPQTFSNSSSNDSIETASVISEIPRRIQFISTAHVGDFTQNERNQTCPQQSRHLKTVPRDQGHWACSDVRLNYQEVTVPLAEAGNLTHHQQNCPTKRIILLVVFIGSCIAFTAISIYLVVTRRLKM